MRKKWTRQRTNVLQAIERRVSVRSYAERPVERSVLERLLAVASASNRLTEMPPRVTLVNRAERTQRIIKFIVGSYGLIQTPLHLLVGVIPEESDLARLHLGYVLEQVILEATGRGLATCWITGSYDARRAGDTVGLASGEAVAAVVALGYPNEHALGRLRSQTVRWLAGGHRRKPLKELVFAKHWGEPWSPRAANDPTLVSVLEHARLAPSAHNGQPWRFIVRPDDLVLALVRPEPIDAGIVMAHVALASGAFGHEGRWEIRWHDDALVQVCRLPNDVIPVAVFG